MRRTKRRVGAGAALVGVVLLLVALGSGGGCRGRVARVTRSPATGSDSTAADSAGAIYSANVLPVPDLGYGAREGRTLYRHYCLACHGELGGGDGFNAYNLDPRPQSLADSAFQAQHSDSDLVAAIRAGGGAVGLSTGMPPWGRTLSERQIEHVVEYLRTLRDTMTSEP